MATTEAEIRDATDDDLEPGEQGRVVEVPRLAVEIDDTDPDVLKVAFSGSIELERGSRDQVAFFNSLDHGRTIDLRMTGFVAGAKTTHRRDSEGDVDAVVLTKSVVVSDVAIA